MKYAAGPQHPECLPAEVLCRGHRNVLYDKGAEDDLGLARLKWHRLQRLEIEEYVDPRFVVVALPQIDIAPKGIAASLRACTDVIKTTIPDAFRGIIRPDIGAKEILLQSDPVEQGARWEKEKQHLPQPGHPGQPAAERASQGFLHPANMGD